MVAKELKEWVNGLPDDALIQVLSAPHMSMPLRHPIIHAIDAKSIEKVTEGMMSGKVISSFYSKEPGSKRCST